MTVKMLVGIAGTTFSLAPGDETSQFSTEEEDRLITAGYAERVTTSKVEKAVKPAARETR